MTKDRPLLKSIFSTANFNGAGATLMSVDVGSPVGTAMYIGAVAAGTYNKYRGLTKAEEFKNPILNVLSRPSITASIFVGAAVYNFCTAAQKFMNGSPEAANANLLIMAGWVMGLLGDNALRRLDSVNFKKNAAQLGSSIKGKLKKTFNALLSNPTIFYSLTSTFFVSAGLMNRKDAAGNAIGMFSGHEGILGASMLSLVGLGLSYAGYRTWRAVQGKITNDQINDGTMNWIAFSAKLGYGVLALANKEFGLAAAHLMFAASSIKVIYETRSALTKNSGAAPAPVVS